MDQHLLGDIKSALFGYTIISPHDLQENDCFIFTDDGPSGTRVCQRARVLHKKHGLRTISVGLLGLQNWDILPAVLWIDTQAPLFTDKGPLYYVPPLPPRLTRQTNKKIFTFEDTK